MSNHELIESLVSALKKQEFKVDVCYNLSIYHDGRYIVWNDVDKCLYVCHLDDQCQISFEHRITLSNAPLFAITSVVLSPHGNYLALVGSGGVAIVDMPRHSSIHTNHHSDGKLSHNHKTTRSFLLAERMFFCNRNHKVLSLQWHPLSPKHLFLLTNDDVLRIFNIDEPDEAIKPIYLRVDSHLQVFSAFAASFSENAVSFDFGPPLSRYFQANQSSELAEILPVFILKGNGDVLLIYTSLNDLGLSDRIFGPLRMSPAADDNYGSDASSILCLDCVPPIVVVGTSQGIIYQCIAIENDQTEKEAFQSVGRSHHKDNRLVTCTGLKIDIPELILYVFERIELSYSITSSAYEEGVYDSESMLIFLKDANIPKRYFCLHSSGVHVVQVSFFSQLSSLSHNEFYDEKSIIEYLVCTKPTNKQSDKNDANRIIGLCLKIDRGFTHFTLLMNTGDLIHKRLSNVVVPFEEKQDVSRSSLSVTALPISKRPAFLEHLDRILTKNSNVPLIKSSKPKTSAVGVAELEMLLNSIEIIRKEYLARFKLAAEAIRKRKQDLQNECRRQINLINKLEAAKDVILNKEHHKLLEKCDQAKNTQIQILERVQCAMLNIQNQGHTLTEAEQNLKQEMLNELDQLEGFAEQLEQAKHKAYYQSQSRLSPKSATLNALNVHSSSSPVSCKLNTLQTKLAEQTIQINEMVALLKVLNAQNKDE